MADILVVDDDLFYRNLLVKLVSALGHTAFIAKDGLSAVEALTTRDFDVVLLDVFMENLSGIEVLEIINSLPDDCSSPTPVIAITSDESPETERRIRQLRAAFFVLKPFDHGQLEERIEQALASRSTASSLSTKATCRHT